MKCLLISGVLFTMLWASVLAQRSVPNSLSDSVLSVTKGTAQFALELLQVSRHCIKHIFMVSCGCDCSWFVPICAGQLHIQCSIKFSVGSGIL